MVILSLGPHMLKKHNSLEVCLTPFLLLSLVFIFLLPTVKKLSELSLNRDKEIMDYIYIESD